jgi:hypothetical protein
MKKRFFQGEKSIRKQKSNKQNIEVRKIALQWKPPTCPEYYILLNLNKKSPCGQSQIQV